MHLVTPDPQPARWRVTLDVAWDLHHALFFREALRLSTLPDAGQLAHPVPELTATSDHLAAGWDQWWSRLLTHTGGPATAADPLLSAVVDAHEDDFRHWWNGSGRAHPGQKMLLATALRDVRPEADLLAGRGEAVELSVDVLALDGVFHHALSPVHVVVSDAFRRTTDYPDWLAATVFP